ncbi:MAG: hypothetical protein AABX83_02145 [Nanoarchaeota archaeon]
MEKDIDRITKNADTDIVIRVDDFGGKRGVTIREFIRGERYTGFTKAGTRIPAEHFKAFKEAINSIDEKEMMSDMPKAENDSNVKNIKTAVKGKTAKPAEKSLESDEFGEEEI